MGYDMDDLGRDQGDDAIREAIAHAKKVSPQPSPSPRFDPNKEKPRPRYASFSIDEIEAPCLEVFFLIHGLMVKHGVQLTYGPSSVGKTFAMLHALLHVASGRKYNGRRTEKALVVYVTGEGERMFRNRIWLAKKRLRIKPGDAAFRGTTDMPNLGKNEVDAKELIKAVKAIAAEPQYAGLSIVVVIDTVSTALKGAKEDEVGLGLLMSNSKLIADELDGLTIVIHHTGKDTGAGPRGSYVTIGNSDVVWRIEELESSESGGKIIVEKNRDGPKDIYWTFERKTELLGMTEDGDEVTTCHIELTSEPQFLNKKAEGNRGQENKRKLQTKYRAHFDQAFNNAIIANSVRRRLCAPPNVEPAEVVAVKVNHVREEFFRICGEETKDAKRVAFNRELAKLFREYPQEEDQTGTRWIWKLQS